MADVQDVFRLGDIEISEDGTLEAHFHLDGPDGTCRPIAVVIKAHDSEHVDAAMKALGRAVTNQAAVQMLDALTSMGMAPTFDKADEPPAADVRACYICETRIVGDDIIWVGPKPYCYIHAHPSSQE